MNKKKFIEETIDVSNYFDVDTIDEWISTLNILKEKYDGSSKLILDSYYSNYNMKLIFNRIETDSEYNKRIDAETKLADKEKDKRKKMYEKLKKEFEA